MPRNENDAYEAKETYGQNAWPRNTSSIPDTVAYTETPRASPMMDGVTPTSPNGADPMDLPTRPGSSGTSEMHVLTGATKRLMDGVNNLRHLGFETSVMALPKIVVVGDQSTGKSSVIESIRYVDGSEICGACMQSEKLTSSSGIKVPRNAGTCTRCPLEIGLTSSSSPWTCKVSLRTTFKYAPQSGRNRKGSSQFPDWEKQSIPVTEEFAVLHSKEDVAETLWRAQLAILNPGTHYSVYQAGNDDKRQLDGRLCEFSPNVVRLEISGPGLPDLAFFDLPGMISHVAHHSQSNLPKLIEELVRDYVKSAKTIVLLTLTMNHDVQNSKTAGFISKIKTGEDGTKADNRTVGVFTKPDLISPDSEALFERILSGREFRRELGYFVVKNNHDPTVAHAVARAEELAFFQHDFPVKCPRLARYVNRFGTVRLQEELSRLLAKLIRESIPGMRLHAEQQIERLRQELATLPQPPAGNLSLQVNNLLVDLRRQLEDMFRSSPGNATPIYKQLQKLYKDFHDRMTNSYPRLERYKPAEQSSRFMNEGMPTPSGRTNEVVSLVDDDEDEDMTPATTSHSLKRPNQGSLSDNNGGSSKRARLDEDSEEELNENATLFTLDGIRDMMSSMDDTGIAGPSNAAVTSTMFQRSTSHWHPMTVEFVNNVSGMTGRAVTEAAEKCFLSQKETRLFRKVREVIRSHVIQLFQGEGEFAKRILGMSRNVFALNRELINLTRDRAIETMLVERRVEKALQRIEEQERESGRAVPEQTRMKQLAQARIGGANDKDEYQGEIEQMATALAYYKYAATRLCEMVVLSIREEVMPNCSVALCEKVVDELHLRDEDANAYVRSLLEVSPEVAKTRKHAEEQLSIMYQGLEQLHELEESSDDCDSPGSQMTMV